jgi:hypothetical protein
MILHAAVEHGRADTSGVPEIFSAVVGELSASGPRPNEAKLNAAPQETIVVAHSKGLTHTHLSYIAHWNRLLSLEYSAQTLRACSYRAWTISSSVREENREPCLSALRVHSCVSVTTSKTGTDNGYELVLVRMGGQLHKPGLQNPDYLNSTCTERCRNVSVYVGDRVIISKETYVSASRGAEGSSSASSASSGACNPHDMEDLASALGSISEVTSISSRVMTDLNVCVGVVEEITDDLIRVRTRSSSTRLRR